MFALDATSLDERVTLSGRSLDPVFGSGTVVAGSALGATRGDPSRKKPSAE
jgi:hypothetical protein